MERNEAISSWVEQHREDYLRDVCRLVRIRSVTGEAEAGKVGRLLSNVSFDKIYVSDLSRAKATARIALPECEYETFAELREINVGSISGKPRDSIKNIDKETVKKDGYRIFGN